MSRIGKKPVLVPADVTVELSDRNLAAKGARGELAMQFVTEVNVKLENIAGVKQIIVEPLDQTKRSRSMWGMQRTLVANMIDGVSNGFSKSLEIRGVGFRAQSKGKILNLQLGFSHDIDFPVPDGITIETPSQTSVKISGADKQLVGQVAAEIRSYRKPEPYKGKGVRYAGEYIFRKEGKKK